MVDKMGDRFKAYENVNRFYLTRRMPCILRLDMCHAHTYTKNFNHPFDRIFMKAMGETAKQLCQSIMGAKLAYVQSDEISILLMMTPSKHKRGLIRICKKCVVWPQAWLLFFSIRRMIMQLKTFIMTYKKTKR